MGLRIEALDVDCADPRGLAAWWAEALGWRVDEEDSDDDAVAVVPPEPGAPALLFLKVPEPKTVKNRWHLDLRPDDRDAEVARLEAMGARRVDVGQGDVSWVVLADPEGNELCVLRAAA